MKQKIDSYTKREMKYINKATRNLQRNNEFYLLMSARFHVQIKKIDMALDFAKANNYDVKHINRLETLKLDFINHFGSLFDYNT